MFNIWTGKGNNERRSIYVLQIYVNVQCEMDEETKNPTRQHLELFFIRFVFFFQCTWLVRKKPLSFLLFIYLFLFLQVGNEESISSSSCIRMIIYVLLYKKKDYLRILFCSLTGKIRSTSPDRAAWCIEGSKVKNELRSFIYLKMTFFKTNLNIA